MSGETDGGLRIEVVVEKNHSTVFKASYRADAAEVLKKKIERYGKR